MTLNLMYELPYMATLKWQRGQKTKAFVSICRRRSEDAALTQSNPSAPVVVVMVVFVVLLGIYLGSHENRTSTLVDTCAIPFFFFFKKDVFSRLLLLPLLLDLYYTPWHFNNLSRLILDSKNSHVIKATAVIKKVNICVYSNACVHIRV